MVNFKKLISTITTSVCLLSIFIIPNTQAGLIELLPEDIVKVSQDGDKNSAGTVLVPSDYEIYARERTIGSKDEEKMRTASFIQFDLSSLTTDIVNSSFFSASFEADFVSSLNDKNNMSVMLGQVTDEWDNVLGDLPLFELADSSINEVTLVGNVKNRAYGTYSVDVTTIVQDWVNGDALNNGLVVFGKTPAFQGAGFDNVALQVEVPEPSTLAIFALGIIGLASRRFKKKA